GGGFPNEFRLYENGKVIIDESSGLYWQQSASAKRMTYKQAQHYIDYLNLIQFAGFDDWRLPTLEEAMTLVEKTRQDEKKIAPLFDQ
ncbi:MAG: DUF1566 domain-containing protein, partial [Calditrichae bacterium]|nr:DUF1566 domain-containing protein [Calditrichia bacterium]